MKGLVCYWGLLFLSLFSNVDIFGQDKQILRGTHWQDVLVRSKGEIIFYWYQSKPLIFVEKDSLRGIEYEIAKSFKNFVEEEYGVTLIDKWVHAAKFENLLNDLEQAEGGVFSMSGISVTEGRKSSFQFTPAYLPDICVIVSSPDVPVEHTVTGFVRTLKGLTALTLKGSTFEKKLQEIEGSHDIQLQYEYIDKIPDVTKKLENRENAFGYVDLASFLIDLNNGTSVRRQFFYPLQFPGLSFAYPLDSDWAAPVEAYFNSNQYQLDRSRILNKYFGADILDLMQRIATTAKIGPEEEIIILTKERELQYEELLNQNMKIQSDQKLMVLMFFLILLVLFLATIFYTRYRVKLAANLALAEQQAEIESKNRQLSDLNNEKDHLIRVLAHDLRAPIGRMVGITQLLMNDLENEKQELLGHIVKDAEKLDSLITKILDVEAIDSHKHNLNIEDTDVIPLINDLIRDYKVQADKKNICFVTKFANDEIVLKVDRIYFRQVLDNLLSNALKFSEKGTTVVVEIDEENVVHIKDQGPGFTASDQHKVFKKFQRLSAQPTGGEQSTGLGLATVHMFVELMGGKISFDSIIDQGTTFHIMLPRSS